MTLGKSAVPRPGRALVTKQALNNTCWTLRSLLTTLSLGFLIWKMAVIILQLILIIFWFYIWEHAYLLNFICNSQVNTWNAFMAICGHAQSSKKICTLPVKVQQGVTLLLLFQLSYWTSVLFNLRSATFFTLCAFAGDFAFGNGPWASCSRVV